MLVCLKYWLCARVSEFVLAACEFIVIYLNTFENSPVGETTKLSLPDDHEMRCRMVSSSSMLFPISSRALSGLDGKEITCRVCE